MNHSIKPAMLWPKSPRANVRRLMEIGGAGSTM
jgi:hypothetical protein